MREQPFEIATYDGDDGGRTEPVRQSRTFFIVLLPRELPSNSAE
jgi:hypothetical protein